MHERTVGGIRILSDAYIYPFLSGSVDRVQMLSAGSPVPATARLEMSNHDANAGLSGNVDDLIQSFRHVVGLITHVHVKQTVVESGRFGQRDQFLRGLVLVWRINEPSRYASRALLHALRDGLLHAPQLCRSWRTIFHAHDIKTDSTQSHVGTDVDARHRGVHPVQIG